jgi:exosortase H (IPTLxxWG-CTERM-specific)
MVFVFFFSMAAVTLYTVLAMVPEGFFGSVNRLNAVITGYILKAAGLSPRINGDLISCDGFAVKIIKECSALFISVLPLAFFLSYPSRMGKRFIGITVGLFLLFVLNILRISVLFLIGRSYPGIFPWAHVYIGEVVMAVLSLWICMAWVQWEAGTGGWGGRRLLWTVLISFLLFSAWSRLCRPYTWMVLHAAGFILDLAGIAVRLPETLSLYPVTFISFNMVVILSLILADPGLRERMNLKRGMAGFAGLVFFQIVFQILPVVVPSFVLPFVFRMAFIPRPANTRKARPVKKGLPAGSGRG